MPIINTQIAGGGTQPTGTLNITTNGVTNVAQYEYADVQVPTSAPTHYIERINNGGTLKTDGVSSMIDLTGIDTIDSFALAYAYCMSNSSQSQNPISMPNFSSVTKVNSYGCDHAFAGCKFTNTALDLSNIQTMGSNALTYAFEFSNITSVDCSGITSIPSNCFGNTFYFCRDLVSANFSGVEIIKSASVLINCFTNCYSLQSVDFSNLRVINDNNGLGSACFANCSQLTTVHLEKLEYSLYGFQTVFQNCSALPANPFVALRYVSTSWPFNTTFDNCTSMTDGTFPKLELIKNTSAQDKCFQKCTSMTKLNYPCLTKVVSNTSNATFKSIFGGTNTTAVLTDIKFPMFQVFTNKVFDATCFTRNAASASLTLHFRMDAQTAVSAQTGYASNFGANAIAFDLVGKITVNGVDYLREETMSQTGYTAWHKAASTITVSGTTYTLDQTGIDCWHPTSGDDFSIVYAWTDGNNTIYTDKINPSVGDFIYTSMTAAQSTTESISAVSTDFVYTDDSAEAQVGDNVYSDQGVTLVGTVSAIA